MNNEVEMHRAVEILKKHNKYFGIACGMDESAIEFWLKFETDMLIAGADWNYIYQAGCETFKKLTSIWVNDIMVLL